MSSRSAASGSSPLINTRGAGTAGERPGAHDRAQAPAAGRGVLVSPLWALGHGGKRRAAGRRSRSVRAVVASGAALCLFAHARLRMRDCARGDKIRDPARTMPLRDDGRNAVGGPLTLAACGAVLFLLPYEIAAKSPAPFADAIAPALGSVGGHGHRRVRNDQRARRAQRLGALLGRGPAEPWRAPATFPAWFGKTTAMGTPVRAQISTAVLAACFVASQLQRLDGRALHLHRRWSRPTRLWSFTASRRAGRAQVEAGGCGPHLRGRVAFHAVRLLGRRAGSEPVGVRLLVGGVPICWLIRRSRGGSSRAAAASPAAPPESAA